MNPDIEKLIKQSYHSFTGSEKTIADYVMTHGESIINDSLSQLSAVLQLSDASIIRFSRKLGFDGFKAFKLYMARNMGNGQRTDSPLLIDDQLKEESTFQNVPIKSIAATIRSLQETLKLFDHEKYALAVHKIINADLIDLYGAGTSGSVAYDFNVKLMRLGLRARANPDVHLQHIGACHLTRQDVAIGISHSGRTKDTIDGLRIARESGAFTIAVTNYKSALIHEYADICFFTCDAETSYFTETMTSRISQLAILDILYRGIILSDRPGFTKRLDKLNKQVRKKVY